MTGDPRPLTGWGRTAPSVAEVATPASVEEAAAAVDKAPVRGVIARGLGRSYGDQAQNAGGLVVDMCAVGDITSFDPQSGLVTADAGASLEALMRLLVPSGWFVPVSPGTRHVTVGGAIAADIHGKNHHLDGSWCHHVRSLHLKLPDGDVREVTPDSDPDLFWATAGGMGLTGVILDATFQASPIEMSSLIVDTDRAGDLDEVMALMERDDADHPFSVAWIDLLASGASTGRSVLTRGRFAGTDDVPTRGRHSGLSYQPRRVVTAPRTVPNGLLNRWTIAAFNEFWYRKAPRQRRGELQSITAFFHPLDLVEAWNRLYGRRGLLQWQVVIPFGQEPVLRTAVETLSAHGVVSFLAVLQRFGPGNRGHLSFPLPGWTLALDVPAGDRRLSALLDDLDERVAEAGGRTYLAKDSRMRPEMVPAMYPRLDEWRRVCDRADPERVLTSDLDRRLGLRGAAA